MEAFAFSATVAAMGIVWWGVSHYGKSKGWNAALRHVLGICCGFLAMMVVLVVLVIAPATSDNKGGSRPLLNGDVPPPLAELMPGDSIAVDNGLLTIAVPMPDVDMNIFNSRVGLVCASLWMPESGADVAPVAPRWSGVDRVRVVNRSGSHGFDFHGGDLDCADYAELTGAAATEFIARRFTEFGKLSADDRAAICRDDLKCWAEQYITEASVYCARDIERLGAYSSRWTAGTFEQKFSRYSWLDKDKGTLTYMGDSIEFQNGFGAYQAHVYACDFDPASNQVLDVRASAGRL